MGIFRPKIYLPQGLSEQEQEYIILHEKCHIRRCDHIVKLSGVSSISFEIVCTRMPCATSDLLSVFFSSPIISEGSSFPAK